MKVVILCGGMGTRLREETEYKPKPMVEIGGHPILWHIMKTYSFYGFTDFVLCLGYKGDVIKDYFYNYKMRNNDFSINLTTGDITLHDSKEENNWNVTLANTGLTSMTGARIKRVQKYIEDDTFMVTYGDGVTDLNISKLLEYHQKHGKVGTVTGVHPPSRYGELRLEGDCVTCFDEKPETGVAPISGGYFVFNKEIFDYLDENESCVLEKSPLSNLAKDGQLKVYHHKGFWQCMDTYRDNLFLNDLWKSNMAPWKVK
ncbi:glucose-1-phosphate cytidylyltransferase [uncultured Methanomethylovorans sp.]|uniref:glucose-1-phosphate cytidylyltransferase n=1 Tax=uncultured Methanomethylovorans sp. TaxID=183759 RepID=UPI002AA67B9A|nr:glucose-1-phosphate cytidylyltransferase [uncultured Methanomethylovorans sp.]